MRSSLGRTRRRAHPGVGELTGPVLRDGTPVAQLIDRGARTLAARIHADDEIFDLELERIFASAWIVVGHESEFEQVGDYATRYIGRDPVIVSRGSDGHIHVSLNVCTHRGAAVCRSEVGNTMAHKCAFHGWAFAPDGELVGVPFERLHYSHTVDGSRLDKSRLALRQARVDIAAGVVFACWDPDAPSLDEYLGDFRFYLDAQLARTKAGMEVAGPPQRYVIDANWKVIAEGFFGDAYHVITVHRSFNDLGKVTSNTDRPLYTFKASDRGHTMLCFDYESYGLVGPPEQILRMAVPPGMPVEMVDEVFDTLSPEQVTLLATTPPSVGGIWPSAATVFIGGGPSSEVGQTASLRCFVPLGPHRTELVSFSLVERDAPAEFKRAIHGGTARSFGAAGLFESDDSEVWASVQRGVQGFIGRQSIDNYQATAAEVREPDPARPGLTGRGLTGDDAQWHFYERYFDAMTEGR